MKRFAAVVFLCVLLSVCVCAGTYYIPHVAGSSAWETHLILDNTHTAIDTQATVVLFNESGSQVTTLTVGLAPGENRTISLQPLGAVSGTVTCASRFVIARVGYIASTASGGGTAEFDLPGTLHPSATFKLSNYYDQLTWSGFALFNGTDEPVTVTPRYITTDGVSHTGTAFSLPARQKRVNYFETQLGVPFATINTVIFETDSPALTGITISGMENEKLLFTRSSENRNGWDNTDVYPRPSGTSDELFLIGQAVTASHLAYLVRTEGTGFAFANRLKMFDRHSGEFVSQTDFGVDFNALGILATETGNSIIVYGIMEDELGGEYYLMRFDPDDGSFIRQRYVDDLGEFDTNEPYKKNIRVAATADTVAAAYQIAENYIVCRLFNEMLTSPIDDTGWVGDLILGDLYGHQGTYYLLWTSFNLVDEVYNELSLYEFPYTGLTGTLYESVVDMPRGYGEDCHVMVGDAIMNGDRLWYGLKVSIGEPLYRNLRYLGISAADFQMGSVDLDDHDFHVSQEYYRHQMTMDTTVASAIGPDGQIYSWASNPVRTVLIQWISGRSRSFTPMVVNPVVNGDDLYLVTHETRHDNLGLGSPRDFRIRTRKTSFTDYYLNGK